MALTQVTGPYPIFTDLDGTPLDDGYLYIGEINEDPEQNPIQVFFDANLTIPATQPIRTSNGYAYRNGTPALLYTGGEFSITIRNKRNEFVLYSPVGYGFDPAAVSASVVKNDFIGDGVTVAFALSAAPSTILATNVFINGVYQEKDSYSLSGNTITFSVAPPLSSSIEVMTNETGVINTGNATAISYTASFAGATAQTVQTKLEQYISVKDFGAVGDGVADDTAAIQAALDNFKLNGIPILLNGNFRVTGPLTFQTQGNVTGLRLVGTGIYDSSIIADFNGPTLFDIDGSSLQANSFQNGGGFSDFQITTDVGAVVENAITCNGWWYAAHNNLLIGNFGTPSFTKNGIFIPLRNDIDLNPDAYASFGWILTNVQIDGMGEYGVYGANNQGYAGWQVIGGRYERNGLDGLYINANNWRVENVSASVNGRYGINYTGSAGNTLTNGYFNEIEFDGNDTAGLRISTVTNGMCRNLRFISRVLSGNETQLVHVLGDLTNSLTSVQIVNSYHRIETGITSSVTLYDFGGSGSSNIQGNSITGYLLINTAGAPVVEQTAALLDLRYKNLVSDRFGAQKIASPPKFAHSSQTTQAVTNTLSTWIFNTAVADTGWTNYNTTTGILTAPHNGFYFFHINFNLSNIPTGDFIIVNLKQAGSVVRTYYWDLPVGVGADRWNFDASDLLTVTTGQQILVEVQAGVGTATLFGNAKLDIFAI
jgi:hypothetical protein